MKRWGRRLIALAAAAGTLWTVPAWWCGRRADAFYDGERATQLALARSVGAWLARDPDSLVFGTGSSRFDGEWFLIGHMAAALGLAQIGLEHRELQARHARLVARAIDRMLLPRGRAHDLEAWGEDPLEALAGDRGHLAFLGYMNLALSMHRRLDPRSRFAAQNDAITQALSRRYAAAVGRGTLLESYPGETYPADNAAALASIVLHDRLTGRATDPAVRRALETLGTFARDPRSGLLYQRVDSATGAPRDGARASGTAMAALVLGYAERRTAGRLWTALARQFDTVLGFGGIREYPVDAPGRPGCGTPPDEVDVDSGPVILGFSVSASGIALASARRAHDRARFRGLFTSAWLLGLPREHEGALHFVAGGPLGDALLLALLTAGAP